MRFVADYRNIVIKKADNSSSMIVWDTVDNMKSWEQLSKENIYWKIECSEKILTELVETSNCLFNNLKIKGCISDKNLKYSTYEIRKSASLGKLHLLLKINKRFFDWPQRPVISNCAAVTRKVS